MANVTVAAARERCHPSWSGMTYRSLGPALTSPGARTPTLPVSNHSHERGPHLGDVVRDGFFCYPAFMNDSWLNGVRNATAFEEVVAIARHRHEAARRSFLDADGDALLGGSARSSDR